MPKLNITYLLLPSCRAIIFPFFWLLHNTEIGMPLLMVLAQGNTSLLRRLQGRPFPMQLPQQAKSTNSAKFTYLLNPYSDLDALQALEFLNKCQYSLIYD